SAVPRRPPPARARATSSELAGELLPAGTQPPARDVEHRLDHDVPAHLRNAEFTLHERDRYLHDLLAHERNPEGHVDLEAVSHGFDLVEVQGLQGFAAEGPEARGDVADPQPQHESGIRAAGNR